MREILLHTSLKDKFENLYVWPRQQEMQFTQHKKHHDGIPPNQ